MRQRLIVYRFNIDSSSAKSEDEHSDPEEEDAHANSNEVRSLLLSSSYQAPSPVQDSLGLPEDALGSSFQVESIAEFLI